MLILILIEHFKGYLVVWRYRLSLIFLFVITTMIASHAHGECVESPSNTFTCDASLPNPDLTGVQQADNDANLTIRMLTESIIDTTVLGEPGIQVGDGDNLITMDGAVLLSPNNHGLQTGTGDNEIKLTDSRIECEDDCLDLGGGQDTIEIVRSTIVSNDNNAIDGRDGPGKNIQVRQSALRAIGSGDNFGIWVRDGDDRITLSDSVVQGNRTMGDATAIIMGAGDDVLTIGDRVEIIGKILCGDRSSGPEAGTIVFQMGVPAEELADINQQIENADPLGDVITINGFSYEWQDCSSLVAELSISNPLKVPSTGIYGLFVLALLMLVMGGLALTAPRS